MQQSTNDDVQWLTGQLPVASDGGALGGPWGTGSGSRCRGFDGEFLAPDSNG
jgi:hypothetical protein